MKNGSGAAPHGPRGHTITPTARLFGALAVVSSGAHEAPGMDLQCNIMKGCLYHCDVCIVDQSMGKYVARPIARRFQGVLKCFSDMVLVSASWPASRPPGSDLVLVSSSRPASRLGSSACLVQPAGRPPGSDLVLVSSSRPAGQPAQT